MKKRIIDVIIAVLLCVMAFSGYKLYSDIKESRESQQQFQQLEDILSDQLNKTTTLTAAEKYAPVYRENDHFIGWLAIDGTQLNYPVLQTKNNPEYYLRRDFTRKYNYHGVPFMDYKCTVNESDNLIIYSHNMKDGSMFSAVEDYMKQDFFENHRYVKFDSMESYGLYEVVCIFKTDITTSDFAYYDAVDFNTEEEFDSFINTAKDMAPYESGVNAAFGDKLLTLSTCEYTMENGRCVLIAKKIRDMATKTFDSAGNEIAE